MKNFFRKTLFTLILLSFTSCFETKLDTPEALLQHYVYLAFGGVDGKDLEQYLAPDFLQKIKDEQAAAGASARQISFQNLKLKKYKVLNKNCEKESECQIRFEVSYQESNKETKNVDFVSETTKIAVLKQYENKEWKIIDIDHLTTRHEIKEEIKVPLKE